MKNLFCVLVLMVICSATVNSLQCFTCVDGFCKIKTECPPSANFCRTEANLTYVSRTCEEFCTPGETLNTEISCCTQDFCG
ncbi:hypothetical protein DNTS_001241 [Danionella cerebrum]|uniref:Snake toxin/toxin-like domain-containing protein n=1 Tax=Danionella cerebrum TaxID=2873325 RepID=A0A553R9Y3_9TELE|nr:hypothetical protein DNTS_001241 [Danionella translucida]